MDIDLPSSQAGNYHPRNSWRLQIVGVALIIIAPFASATDLPYNQSDNLLGHPPVALSRSAVT